MKDTAKAARLFGVGVVNGFTGSSIWKNIYFFPPTNQDDINKGYKDFADRWTPILDVFQQNGVKFGLEVHPTEIAYDIITARRALDAVGLHPAFGFNFDPSHFIHQFLDPVEFVTEFGDRIWHVHVKDSRVQLTGRNSILSSHLDFGDYRRGWDFVSPGRGDVKWDRLIRAFNRVGYKGPLSIEWEDSGMDREWGAPEALEMIRHQDFTASAVAFDAAFTAKSDY
jgi:sugar phosphate isomerase/epimerase